MVKFLSLGLLGFGVFVLMQAALPLISFKTWELVNLQSKAPLVTPLSSSPVLGVSITTSNEFPKFISTNLRAQKPLYDTFQISIPKLKISDAVVTVESNELDLSLAHLPGTALPGEIGNVFISGHSSGFNSKLKDKTYLDIFKDLPKLDKGDEVVVSVGGQQFVYKVKGLLVVDPKNLSVINPPDSMGRYLSLMTCVPPGTYLKRLVVLAELQ